MKKQTRTLNVIETTISTITEKWGVAPLVRNRLAPVFMRCNAKGQVNWDKAPYYQLQDLVGKKVNFVSVIK
jgi:hypothetical protein